MLPLCFEQVVRYTYARSSADRVVNSVSSETTVQHPHTRGPVLLLPSPSDRRHPLTNIALLNLRPPIYHFTSGSAMPLPNGTRGMQASCDAGLCIVSKGAPPLDRDRFAHSAPRPHSFMSPCAVVGSPFPLRPHVHYLYHYVVESRRLLPLRLRGQFNNPW